MLEEAVLSAAFRLPVNKPVAGSYVLWIETVEKSFVVSAAFSSVSLMVSVEKWGSPA